jgi:putative copper resistance protein D
LGLKLSLFAAMLGLAAINRWKITPALERGDAAGPMHLKRSLVLEMALGLGVVGIVALLGVLDPVA